MRSERTISMKANIDESEFYKERIKRLENQNATLSKSIDHLRAKTASDSDNIFRLGRELHESQLAVRKREDALVRYKTAFVSAVGALGVAVTAIAIMMIG